MPKKQKNESEQRGDRVGALCNECGKTFSEFLHEMEQQNAKVVCPSCGKEHDSTPTSPAAAKKAGLVKKH